MIRLIPDGHSCLRGTAWRESTRTTDEKPASASTGLTDQVALRRSYPPSFQIKLSRDLDSSRAVCPISRSSENHGPQFGSTPIRKPCQWRKPEFFLKAIKHNLCPKTVRIMSALSVTLLWPQMKWGNSCKAVPPFLDVTVGLFSSLTLELSALPSRFLPSFSLRPDPCAGPLSPPSSAQPRTLRY